MKNDAKSLTVKRIILFLVLSFVPVYILGIVFSDKQGGLTSSFAGYTVMFYPMIANILTRLVTHDKEDLLLAGRRGTKKKYYLFAAIFPVVCGFILGPVLSLICKGGISLDPSVKETGTAKVFIGTLLMQLGLCVPMLINGFGEEFGWRGYLTPKLEKLMPTAPAVAVTGVIWAVWHAPLIWYGYDFGRDYPGFPYVGILFMCIGCVFASVPLTYLTKKTGSVLPAAIFHIVLDNCMTLPIGLFINAEQMGKYSHIAGLVILSVPGIIAGVMILIAEKRSKKAAQAA